MFNRNRRITLGRPVVTHVAMAAEVLQQLDLAQGALGENFLAENIGDLFDGDALVGLSVDSGAVIKFLSLAKKKIDLDDGGGEAPSQYSSRRHVSSTICGV